MKKIFQIGFHVCGTRSLESFFQKNKFKTFHHYNGILANQLFDNLKDNKTFFIEPLIGPFNGNQGIFYSDMENWVEGSYLSNKKEGYKLFKEIDNGNPDSLFILNVRDNWVDSKLKKFRKYKHWRNSKIKEEEARDYWIKDITEHHKNVREYFKDNKNFIEFHITKDPIIKLVKWLSSHNFNITYKNFPKIRG